MHTNYLVKLAKRSNVFTSGVAPCIIVYCTLIKLVLKYSPHHVDRFEKKLTSLSNLLVKM